MVASRAEAQILSYLATAPAADTSGAAISKATGLGAATVYPSLAALENEGLILGAWEAGPSPRRRLYRLTPAGQQQVGAMQPAQTERQGAGNWFWQRFVAPFFGG